MLEEAAFKRFIEMIANEVIISKDDPRNLMSKSDLTIAISANSLYQSGLAELFRKGLIMPVNEKEKLYHVGITFDFLSFQKKLEIMGFSVRLQQKIAEMYYALYWAMIIDIEYEITEFKREKGRDPSKPELARIKAINEWVVANNMCRREDRIVKLEPEGNEELKQMMQEAARMRNNVIKKATYRQNETRIRKIIEEVWQFPLLIYQEREIKAFIDPDSVDWNSDERQIVWKGHFDFSLCDETGKLQLVVEYNGKGHYGNSEKERQIIVKRDYAKKSVCAKAGVPLIVLTAEFAWLTNFKKILEKFLVVFKDKQKYIDFSVLSALVNEPFHHDEMRQVVNVIDKMGMVAVDNILQRLDIYEIQQRQDLILALIWELYTELDDFSTLDTRLGALINEAA